MTAGSPSTTSATPARLERSASSDTTASSSGRTGNRPERDDPGAGLELGEEQDLVDQLADLLDLDARLLDELRDVLARQRRGLEEGEQPGERRPQLVGDGSGEARCGAPRTRSGRRSG